MAFDDSQEHNFSFADFEVNLAALELRKGGIKIHLEGQPIRVLCVLLERHGKVVTRKELKESLWADNTFVDFDNGVNQAISKIRRVLGDSSVRPRFVETLPRRGYRFIQTELLNGSGHSGLDADHRIDDPLVRYKILADIEESDDSIKYVAEDTELHRPVAIRVSPQSSAEKTERAQHRKLTLALAAAALGVFLALVFAIFPPFSPSPGIVGSMRRFTLPTDGVPSRPFISPNGQHVAYLSGLENSRTLWVQDLDQDEPRALTEPAVLSSARLSCSPDSRFVAFRSQGGVKKVAVSGGPVVNLAEPYNGAGRPAWTPDGEPVIFTPSRKLYSVPARGGKAEVWLEPEEEFGAYAAAFLSADEGSQKLLYVEGRSSTEPQIVALDRSSGQRETLAVGRNPVYASSGHVIYDSAAGGIGRANDWARSGSHMQSRSAHPLCRRMARASPSKPGTMTSGSTRSTAR